MSWILNDSKPVYLQIIDQVKRKILVGEYQSGSKLPSVRDLAVEASVNPNTMQRALSDLEREGMIYAERTTGRFVTEDKEMIDKMKADFASEIIKGFIASLKQLGFTPTEIVLAVKAEIE